MYVPVGSFFLRTFAPTCTRRGSSAERRIGLCHSNLASLPEGGARKCFRSVWLKLRNTHLYDNKADIYSKKVHVTAHGAGLQVRHCKSEQHGDKSWSRGEAKYWEKDRDEHTSSSLPCV